MIRFKDYLCEGHPFVYKNHKYVTGDGTYYCDSKNISREEYNKAKEAHTLDSIVDISAHPVIKEYIEVQAKREKLLSDYCAANGLDKEAFVKKANAKLRSITDQRNTKICVRVDQNGVLEKILKDGRLKSQHESKTTAGDFDPETRKYYERCAFSLSKDTPVKNYPIYGSLKHKTSDGEIDHSDGWDETYGDAVIVLKQDARKRSTVTFGDSLEDTIKGSPLNNPDIMSMNLTKDKLDILAKDSLTEKDYMKIRSTYTEVQIHDGVSVDDIESIEIEDYEDDRTSEIENMVKNAGIKVKLKQEGL